MNSDKEGFSIGKITILDVVYSFLASLVFLTFIIGLGNLFGNAIFANIPMLILDVSRLFMTGLLIVAVASFLFAAILGFILIGKWLVKADDRKASRIANRKAQEKNRVDKKKQQRAKRSKPGRRGKGEITTTNRIEAPTDREPAARSVLKDSTFDDDEINS